MGGTGWSLAWKENLWARTGDGDRAYALLTTQLAPPQGINGGIYPNMFDAQPGAFQIGGNFAATCGVADMLLQSHRGSWSCCRPCRRPGRTARSRACARGGYEADIAWKDGKLTSATIRSLNGSAGKVRYAGVDRAINVGKGKVFFWKNAK